MTEEEEQRITRWGQVVGPWLAIGALVGVVGAHYLDRAVMWVVDALVGGTVGVLWDMAMRGLEWLFAWIPE